METSKHRVIYMPRYSTYLTGAVFDVHQFDAARSRLICAKVLAVGPEQSDEECIC